jgi:hypothetical protein
MDQHGWHRLPRGRVATTPRRRFLTVMAGSAVAAGLGLVGMPALPARALTQGNQGNQYGAVIDDAGRILFTDPVASKLAESGAGWVHINFRLGGFPNWTQSALSVYDQVIATARNHNLQVLGLLSNEAWQGIKDHWSANSAEVDEGDGTNGYIEDYAQHAAGVLVPYFAGRVDVWEIWNEPNLTDTYMHPSNFAQLLARSWNAISSTRKTQTRIVSGGITTLVDGGIITATNSGATYLKQVYAAGRRYAGWETIKARDGSYPLDHVGQHLYIDGTRRTIGERIDKGLSLLRNAYVGEEGSGTPKKTYITEFGWATDKVSEATQARNLQTAYTRVRATSYVQTAYWFFLQDEDPAKLYFGLLRPDGSFKRAWAAYQQYAR